METLLDLVAIVVNSGKADVGMWVSASASHECGASSIDLISGAELSTAREQWRPETTLRRFGASALRRFGASALRIQPD
ncbi:hypothetical protein [Burkholderia lata]|uniref:hypothetical protein n=1 Tax=Burkholderia lata (strain ATCC 17760 / DSM 23089 / LMG 22485 / NCIMB 9086 / R18194 / 383) TaxID=482957 RepID=UPI001582EB46|nr:hypothetical protein [Burkholderia lata]